MGLTTVAHMLTSLFWRVVGLHQMTVCALEGSLRLEDAVGPFSALVTEGKSHVVRCPDVLRVEENLGKEKMILTKCHWNQEDL